MNNIYWVGPRQSDIEDISELFVGSITIYGDGNCRNISYCKDNSRINHNTDNSSCEMFFHNTLESILQQDKQAKFLFYNQKHAYRYGESVLENTF